MRDSREYLLSTEATVAEVDFQSRHKSSAPLRRFLLIQKKGIFAAEFYIIMKLKKRKIKYAAIFFLCWFALLVFLVDGVLKFQTLVDYLGSYALVEAMLVLLVILPTLAVYIFTKE